MGRSDQQQIESGLGNRALKSGILRRELVLTQKLQCHETKKNPERSNGQLRNIKPAVPGYCLVRSGLDYRVCHL